MPSQLSELREMITGTVRAYPDNKGLMKALKAIQWRLRSADGRYVQLEPGLFTSTLGPVETALVFDGRNNEEIKLRWYEMMLKQPLSIEILPQITTA